MRNRGKLLSVCSGCGPQEWQFASRGKRNRGINFAWLRTPLEANLGLLKVCSKPPFLGLRLGFETLGFKVKVGSRYDPPHKLEKGGDFIDKLVERLQLLSKAFGFRFRL